MHYFLKKNVKLPDNLIAEKAFRKLFMPQVLVDEGEYDLVVVGGGVAGIAAAVQAARLNLKVALINNRRMLGGNSSSEIGVPMDGDLYHNKYPKLGRIVREMDNYFTFLIHRNLVNIKIKIIKLFSEEKKLANMLIPLRNTLLQTNLI